jgi:hypothetical protein
VTGGKPRLHVNTLLVLLLCISLCSNDHFFYKIHQTGIFQSYLAIPYLSYHRIIRNFNLLIDTQKHQKITLPNIAQE